MTIWQRKSRKYNYRSKVLYATDIELVLIWTRLWQIDIDCNPWGNNITWNGRAVGVSSKTPSELGEKMIRINDFGTLESDWLLVTDGDVLTNGEAPMLVREDAHPAAAIPCTRPHCSCGDSGPLSGSGRLVVGKTLGTLPYRYIFEFYCSVTADTQRHISFRSAASASDIYIPC